MEVVRNRRLLAGISGLLLAVLALEGALRVWSPVKVVPTGGRPGGGGPSPITYEPDEVLGFKPVIDGPEYAAHGARRNDDPLERTPGVRRVLFIGDSVAQRGKIEDGLAAELAERGETCEIWNAGVGGYSTLQELEYYRRYLEGIHPDHVVLVFHLNDYLTTPVTIRDGERVVTVREQRTIERPIGWLWDVSYLYRLWFRRTQTPPEPTQPVAQTESRKEVHGALVELAALVRERGAEFTVLVLPWLRPESEWPPSLPGKHAAVLGVLERNGIAHFEFRQDLAEALAAGEDVQEVPRDPQHPSPDFGRRMARSLLARGFRP